MADTFTRAELEALRREANKETREQEDARLLAELEAREVASMNPIQKTARALEMGSRGLVDSALEAVAAPLDGIAYLSKQAGLPLTPGDGHYRESLKSGNRAINETINAPLNAIANFGPDRPSSGLERVAYGAGRGASDAAATMLPGGILGKVAQKGGVAANVGKSLTQQPIMQTASGIVGGAASEGSQNNAAGLAAALAVPTVTGLARKAITPVVQRLSPEQRRLAKLAESYGIKLTPGQMTGSQPLLATESSFSQLPFTSTKQHAIYDAQRVAFNKAVLKNAGINADHASPDVLEEAYRSFNKRYDDVIKSTPRVSVDKTLETDVQNAINEHGRRLPTDQSPVFQSYVDDIGEMIAVARQPGVTNVFVDGAAYQVISSNLRRAARGAQANPDLQRGLRALQESLDDAMARSVPGHVAKQWNKIRGEYSNLLQIDKAMAGGTAQDITSGNIPYGAFKNAVKNADKKGYSRGRGAMNDLSRVGTFLSAQRIPDSGTATRSNAMKILQGGSAPAATMAATGAGGGDLLSMLVAGTTTLGLPPIIQKLMNSKSGQSYLRNNIAPSIPGSAGPLAAKLLGAQTLGDYSQGQAPVNIRQLRR